MSNYHHIQVRNQLHAPNLDDQHKMHRILGAYVKRRGLASEALPAEGVYWNAEHFDLHKVSYFRDSDASVQRAIVGQCSQALLREAFCIEKTGMTYCAKLALLAESVEERMVYSQQGADEATHLAWVTPYVLDAQNVEPGPFLDLLGTTVEQGDKSSLVFLMQIVLEGWGLSHYKRLEQHCQHPQLKARLHEIVRDEALHHGSGRALFDGPATTQKQRVYMREYLASLLEMVRLGPQSVVATLDQTLGGLSKKQKETVFEALDCQRSSAANLSVLRELMCGEGVDDIVSELDALNAFAPQSAAVCASVA